MKILSSGQDQKRVHPFKYHPHPKKDGSKIDECHHGTFHQNHHRPRFFEQMVSENSRFDSLLIILNRLGRYITNQCVFIHPLHLPIINLGELLSARVWHAARVPTTRGSFSSQNFEPFSIQMSIFSR